MQNYFAPRKSFRYSVFAALTVRKLFTVALKTPLPNFAQQINSPNQRLIKETLQSVVISGDLNYALVTQYPPHDRDEWKYLWLRPKAEN